MPIINDRTTIYRPDGSSETLPSDEARYLVYRNPGDWSFAPPPPPGWELEVPRYRLTRDLLPAQKARFLHEPPFAETWQSDVWQYGARSYQAGEEIETTAWPHPSMKPLTFGAEKILAFFIGSIKSRLTQVPWHQGRIRLETGLSGALPKLQTMTSRPAA
jgi:hypothetical protein